MNFTQLHEQLRLELLRRIERGVVSGTLPARQTGLKPAHVFNFLHRKRRLSLDALDRVLSAHAISIEELMAQVPARYDRPIGQNPLSANNVALVAQSVAMYESQIRTSSVLELIKLPPGYLDHLRARRSPDRRGWEDLLRFAPVSSKQTLWRLRLLRMPF